MAATLEIPNLPRSLVLYPPPTDEEFESQRSAAAGADKGRREGEILMNAPAGSAASDASSEINSQLRQWRRQHGRGRVYDSSAGIFFPMVASKSPGSAYITEEQVMTLSSEDLEHLLRLVSAFVIELRSRSDSLAAAMRRVEEWVSNRAQLGWLVDPYRRSALVFEPDKEMTEVESHSVEGSGPVKGLVLDLTEVWKSYELPTKRSSGRE